MLNRCIYWLHHVSDGRAHSFIFVGLELDGVTRYSSISNFDASIKMRFGLNPNISCPTDDVITFTQDFDTTIGIQVSLGLGLSVSMSIENFYRTSYALAVYAMAVCPSVCLSVCLSQVGVLLKWLNIGKRKQRHTMAQAQDL